MRRTFILLALLLLLSTVPARAGKPYVIGLPCINENCRIEEIEAIVTEAYARIGASVEFRGFSLERDLTESNNEHVDASLARYATVADQHPELIRVPFPIVRCELVAVTLDPDLRISSAADLRCYKVGLQSNYYATNDFALQAGLTPHYFRELANGLEMLRRDRLDVVVAERYFVQRMALKLGLNAVFTPLEHNGTYHHYLTAKHKDLAPLLDRALEAMQRDGTTASILARFPDMVPTPADRK